MYGSNRQRKLGMDDSIIQKSTLDSNGMLECLTVRRTQMEQKKINNLMNN